MVLFCLSKNIHALECLARRGAVSLYELSMSRLLPQELGCRVRNYAPENESECNETNKYFYKEIGTLTDEDCTRLSKRELVGPKAMRAVRFLITLHRETCGFRTLLNTDTTAGERIALIARIVESVCTDPTKRRKLLAMFPPPMP